MKSAPESTENTLARPRNAAPDGPGSLPADGSLMVPFDAATLAEESVSMRAFHARPPNDEGPMSPSVPPAPLRLTVEPPIGARRYTVVRVQGEASTEEAIEKLIAASEALIAKPVFAIHLDFSGATAADTKLLSALVLLIRKAREARVGVTLGLPEPIATMAVVYRVSELLRPHLVPLGP